MPPSRSRPARIRSAVFTNWPVKVTALVLSAVVWAAVAAEEPATETVPVNLVVEAPPGRALVGPIAPVEADYVGAPRELIELFGTPPVIRKVVPDTLTGTEYTIALSIEDLLVGGDIDVSPEDVRPREVVIALDDITRRTVRVTPRVRLVPDSGYTVVGGIAVVPSTVTIYGPETAVRDIRTISTLPLQLTRVRAPVRRTLVLDTTALGVARVTPTQVEISAEVVFLAERVLMGVPVTVRSDGSEWVADPGAVIVTVRGPNTRIARLTRDSVSVVAVPLAGAGPDTVALEVVPPGGVTAVATPDSAVLSRRARG